MDLEDAIIFVVIAVLSSLIVFYLTGGQKT